MLASIPKVILLVGVERDDDVSMLVAMAFEPTTLIVKIAYGIFGAAAGSIVGER